MGRAGGVDLGVVMLILLILAYILLGLLALVLMLLAIALWSPVDFSGQGTVSVEPADDPMALAGMWMDDDPWGDGDDGPEELEVKADASIRGRIRLLWGAIQLSEKGVRVLWWRVGGARPRDRSGQGGTRGTDGDTTTGQARAAAQDAAGIRARIRARVRREAVDVEIEAGKAAGEDAKSEKAKKQRKKRGTVRFTIRDFRRLWPDIRRALARSWRALRLRLRVFLTIGLEDPATTGVLAGLVPAMVFPLIWSTNARRPGSITCRFTPVFDRETIAAEFELAGRATLYGVAIPWIKLALRRDVRRLWWPWGRRKEKGGQK